MKTLILLSAITILWVFPSFSQTEINVMEASESFESGSHNSLTVLIPQASIDDVEKGWKKILKDFSPDKISVKKEIFADNATIKEISANTMDIYAKAVQEEETVVKLIVAFDLGGAFLSSSQHGAQYDAAKKIVYNFAVQTTKEALKGLQKEAEKVLKEKEKEKEDLVDENESLHKNIEDYKKKIEEAEKDIEENVKLQETKQKEIEDQKIVIEEIIKKEKSVK